MLCWVSILVDVGLLHCGEGFRGPLHTVWNATQSSTLLSFFLMTDYVNIFGSHAIS